MTETPRVDLPAALEALLFLYGEPMPLARVAKALGAGVEEVRAAASDLRVALEREERGLTFVDTGEEFQLVTKAAFHDILARLVKEELRAELTPASAETLAIVAYGGPLTRSEIDYIRGVNSSFTLRSLMIRGLVEREPDPAHPVSYRYRPSAALFRHLGLAHAEALADYPTIRAAIQAFREHARAAPPAPGAASPSPLPPAS